MARNVSDKQLIKDSLSAIAGQLDGGAALPRPLPQVAWASLIDAIEALSGAQSLDHVVGIVRCAARRVSGADGVTFVLREGELCHYVDEDAIGPLWKGQKFPMTACISGWAMLNKRLAVVPDIYADPRIPHDAYRPTFVKSLMMVPVRLSDPIAAIGAYWADRHEPGDQEIALLESLARATATALANIALQELLRAAAEQATAQAAEIRRLYDETVQEAAERLKAEEQLRQAQKMEAVGTLTGGLAHDFNNILCVIIGNLDFACETEGCDGPLREVVDEALDAAMRGADLTRRLLAFARRQPLLPKRLLINTQVENIATLLRRILGEQIEITLRLCDEDWPVVVDPAQLEASIVNLATNARDAMPEGGRLSITTANRRIDGEAAAQLGTVAPGDYVAVEVADSGSGMPPDIAARIFEPFFTTKEKGRGTGLGLAMVAAFVEQSGGRISVYSEPGHGTVFRLYLPRATGAAVDSVDAPAAPYRGGTETVLVLEDNPSLRHIASRALTGLGYRVLEAGTAAEATLCLETDAVDLLFTDLIIAGSTVRGQDFAAIAQARDAGLRVLLTSGFPDALLGADGAGQPPLLTKPYRLEELARAVRAVLDGPATP